VIGTDRGATSADIGAGLGIDGRAQLPAPPGLIERCLGERQLNGGYSDLELPQSSPGAMATASSMFQHHHLGFGVGSPPYYCATDWPPAAGNHDSGNWQPTSAQLFHGQPKQDGVELRTTVMLRNLPDGFSRDMLTAILNDEGFAGLYDFIYMPMNFRTKASFGYAFVNMVSPADAERCHEQLEGFTRWRVSTDKVCEVSWSDMHQGLSAHVDRYRNSPVMHESVPDEYKPVMYSFGVRTPFPPPTKKLRVPRIRRSSDNDRGEDDLCPF